jgi:copper chaperone NosL
MSKLSRILMLLAALSLSLLFFFPMWKIYLKAPQYPEGLEMHIWVNKLGGNTEYSLKNFNILNHYIGMEKINADSFAELKYIPYIVYFLIATGILVAILSNRKLALAWLVTLIVAGSAGLLDFYLWLVKFGTHLNPEAPIKVPGMTYIPPFLGHKQLLNFEALSLPDIGGLSIGLAIILAAIAVYLEFIYRKKKVRAANTLQPA